MNYHRQAMDFSYADGMWHNAIISYSSGSFHVYLDSELSLSKTDQFVGFSQIPANLGSYRKSQFLFQGDIDEISAWRDVLDSDDADKIYNDGVPTQLKYHP